MKEVSAFTRKQSNLLCLAVKLPCQEENWGTEEAGGDKPWTAKSNWPKRHFITYCIMQINKTVRELAKGRAVKLSVSCLVYSFEINIIFSYPFCANKLCLSQPTIFLSFLHPTETVWCLSPYWVKTSHNFNK